MNDVLARVYQNICAFTKTRSIKYEYIHIHRFIYACTYIHVYYTAGNTVYSRAYVTSICYVVQSVPMQRQRQAGAERGKGHNSKNDKGNAHMCDKRCMARDHHDERIVNMLKFT